MGQLKDSFLQSGTQKQFLQEMDLLIEENKKLEQENMELRHMIADLHERVKVLVSNLDKLG